MNIMIRVQIIDSLALVESGLRSLLEAEPDIEMVAHTECQEQCPQQCIQQQPDVLIMNVATNGMCSLSCIQEILATHPEISILVLTEHRDDQMLQHALRMGAKGYATKSMAPDTLAQSVREVAAGKVFVDPDMARQIIVEQTLDDTPPIEKLSAQEYKIMLLLVEGTPIGEIADKVFLSKNTVANYRTNLMQKLGVSNDVELTHLAIRLGIVNA